MAIYEDDKTIFATDIEEIEWALNLIDNNDFGSSSNIYHFRDGLLKVYKKPINQRQLEDLKKLQRLKTKSLVNIIKDLLINDTFYGYYMPNIEGKMISFISDKTEINKLLDSLCDVEKDLIMLGEHHFFTSDLNTLGIIYNKMTHKSTLIDLESYVIDKNSSVEKIIAFNLMTFYKIVFNVLSSIYGLGKRTPYFYRDISVRIVENAYLCQDIKRFFKSVVEELENITDFNIITLKDFRKSLKLSQMKSSYY